VAVMMGLAGCDLGYVWATRVLHHAGCEVFTRTEVL